MKMFYRAGRARENVQTHMPDLYTVWWIAVLCDAMQVETIQSYGVAPTAMTADHGYIAAGAQRGMVRLRSNPCHHQHLQARRMQLCKAHPMSKGSSRKSCLTLSLGSCVCAAMYLP